VNRAELLYCAFSEQIWAGTVKLRMRLTVPNSESHLYHTCRGRCRLGYILV
jgi:hypothetical protein